MNQAESEHTARVVTYDGLPAAAGGAHSLRVKRATDAYERVQRFLTACTEPVGTNHDANETWSFRLNADGPVAQTEELRDFAANRLGGVRSTARTHREWGVRAESVTEVLEVLTASGPSAVTKYGAPLAALTISLPVRLLDPRTRAPWAGLTPEAFGGFEVDGYGRRLGASGVRATCGTSASALSLWLNLPADAHLVDAARHVQANVPFALSAKHWRLWQPTRAGDGYRASKIASPLAAN